LGALLFSHYRQIQCAPFVGLGRHLGHRQSLARSEDWKTGQQFFFFQPSNLPIFILPFFAGVLLTGGWWFSFIWLNFNQVDRLGLLPGSLAARPPEPATPLFADHRW
jgi:hypothetical protein